MCVGGANRFVLADHLMATSVTDETVQRDALGSTQPSTITQPIATTPPSAITQLAATKSEHDYSAECDYSAVCDKPSERDD